MKKATGRVISADVESECPNCGSQNYTEVYDQNMPEIETYCQCGEEYEVQVKKD